MAGIEGGTELKQKHIRTFGPELGLVYNELYNEVVWLYAKWLEYRKLYAASEKQIDVLNETASFFFYTLESVLREDILLHICRLTDHPKKGESKRLSLLLLPKLAKDRKVADELQKLLDECLRNCEFARDWRDRQIAHSNYSLAINPDGKARCLAAVSRQKIGDALASIAKVINRLTDDAPTTFDLFHTIAGADAVVFYLAEGMKSEKRKRERLRSGNPLPEDFD